MATAIGFGFCLMPVAAPARDGHRRNDHEVAREALLRGEIMSLEAVLAEVRKTNQGEFIGVELELKQGFWVYVVKLLTPDRKLTKIKVDARTGKLVSMKREQGE